jgi:chemotaxis protein CheC
MQPFDDDQRDALCEIFNLGVGTAAASLSELVRTEVVIGVPTFELIPHVELANRLRAFNQSICLIWQCVDGAVTGIVSLYYSGQEALDVFNALFDTPVPSTAISEYETDALGEIGNIILNGTVGAVANVLGVEVRNSLPAVLVGSAETIMAQLSVNPDSADRYALLLSMLMDLKDRQVRGRIVLLIDADAVEALRAAIGKYLAALA